MNRVAPRLLAVLVSVLLLCPLLTASATAQLRLAPLPASTQEPLRVTKENVTHVDPVARPGGEGGHGGGGSQLLMVLPERTGIREEDEEDDEDDDQQGDGA